MEAITLTLAALALALLKIRQLLEETRTDFGTGCLNKRCFEQQTQRLRRRGKEFSVVIMDFANFKAANEKLGHVGADRLLATIAGWLRSESDSICRIGGDEFALALPGATRLQALAVRDRIEKRVGEKFIAPRVAVFIAADVATWHPGEDLDEKMKAADFGLEKRKADRKAALGLPATREATLALLA